jgi:hypothetical protein
MVPFHLASSNSCLSFAVHCAFCGRHNNCLRVLRASVVILVPLLPGIARAQFLSPSSFSSLGTLNLAGSNYTIDTDALTIVDEAVPGTPLFTGVADDQNGRADLLNDVWDPNSQGIPEIAVFTFDEIDLQSTANITVVGTRALAFLSHGNATIDTTIDLSGQGVPYPAPAPAGVGRVGGFSGTSGNQVPGDGPGVAAEAPSWVAAVDLAVPRQPQAPPQERLAPRMAISFRARSKGVAEVDRRG